MRLSLRNQGRRIWRTLPPTSASGRIGNAMGQITQVNVKDNPQKKLIKLTLGDPTVTGKFPPPDIVVRSLQQALLSHKKDGYPDYTSGTLEAREAIAERFSTPQAPLTADDIVIASGCSQALLYAFEGLAEPGDNILMPKPGYPIYGTLARPLRIEDRYYNLNMEKGFIDLDHLESLIDDDTKAVIINNPGNPTGVVFSKNHLEDILKIAEKHRIPIIADEVYGSMVYGGAKFYPISDLKPEVPIITCDGAAKRLMVPGWRLGWIAFHDPQNVLSEVKKGIVALTHRMVIPDTLIQGALPKILREYPQTETDQTNSILEKNADTVFSILNDIKGLRVLKPQGAFFAMIQLDRKIYGDDIEFMNNLLKEESVYVLPGTAFNAPGWIRLVTVHPPEVITESCQRIRSYCEGVLKRQISIK